MLSFSREETREGQYQTTPREAKAIALTCPTPRTKQILPHAKIRVHMTQTPPPEEALAALGLTLPQLPAPGGNYLSAKRAGPILYLAGAISIASDGVITGTAGLDRSVDEAYAAARACALTQLAVIKRELGGLNHVAEILTVNGYVNAAPGFPDSPACINGASDLFIQVFGEAGRHVRAAIGVSALPRNALVELQMTVRIAD
jgi:enamine deaminase RidA (YjgF/YER057c/UK114 family)